jgi:hypothetical protein
MLPSEIEQENENALRDCKILHVSQKFKDHFREFTRKNLANEVRHVRQSLGLKNEGLSPKEIK